MDFDRYWKYTVGIIGGNECKVGELLEQEVKFQVEQEEIPGGVLLLLPSCFPSASMTAVTK